VEGGGGTAELRNESKTDEARLAETGCLRLSPPTPTAITDQRTMNKFVDRFTRASSSSTASSSRFQTEEYGYALPLGRGIEKMPMPEFDMPTVLDVSTMLCPARDEGTPR
jgi:hypothetical protein